MGLKDIRKKIDWLDFEILQLVNRRMELVLKTKKFKSDVEDAEREKLLIDKIGRYSKEMIDSEFYKKLFTDIIKESKKLQSRDYKLIGFMGEHGSFGEVAARKWNEKHIPITFSEFSEVFEGVEDKALDYGVVPVENKLGGVITSVNELLISKNINIIGEVTLPIHHCLLALPDTDHREIRIVYSHQQGLSQCRQFLKRNNLEGRPFYNTAAAAKMLSKDKPKSTAVIASKLCAELYDLEVIKENLEDTENNTTRFLVISKEKVENGNKCSIVFSTNDKPGALFSVLELFANEKINLTRIESIPDHEKPENYSFFLDFQSSNKDEKVISLLKKIKSYTNTYKFLGCYPEDK